MTEKLEMPYLDKAIGLGSERQDQQGQFETYLTNKIKSEGGKFIKGLEQEKTQRDIEIIDFALEAVQEYMDQYGRKKDITKPINNIHVLKEEGVFEFTEGKFEDGAHSSTLGSVLVDRVKSDVAFALRLFHENFHSLSYQVLQETNGKNEDRKIEDYRNGFKIITRDGRRSYFSDFEEAVIGKMTQRFLDERILDSDLFSDEEKKIDYIVSRSDEMQKMEKLVNDLWEKNKDKFKNEEEVLNLFIDAQINGNLLKIGKLIEGTYGKGSFRSLGEGGDVISQVPNSSDNQSNFQKQENDFEKKSIKKAEDVIFKTLEIKNTENITENFDDILKQATKSLPKYQQIEKQLEKADKKNLPHELFKVLKKSSDKEQIDEDAPTDGVLIKSMKQGHLECAGRALIASTFLEEHGVEHVGVTAPGDADSLHAFLLIEKNPDTLIYFDANNDLYFTFPKEALNGYEDTSTSSECKINEYTPRESDTVDGMGRAFSYFMVMPAKESRGRQYLGNVSSALFDGEEFKKSNLKEDKKLISAVEKIEDSIYDDNKVREKFHLKINDLLIDKSKQNNNDKEEFQEILKVSNNKHEFVSNFSNVLSGKLGKRFPYIQNATLEQRQAFAERVWNSKELENFVRKESEVSEKILAQKEGDMRDIFRSSKTPLEIIIAEMQSEKFLSMVDKDMADKTINELRAISYENEDDFVAKVLKIGIPILEITQKDKKDAYKQEGRDMYTETDIETVVSAIKKNNLEKIYVVGNVGSGKTTFTREVSRECDFKNIDMDKWFQIFRQEQQREVADLPELLKYISQKEKPPFIINHADLLQQELIKNADMIVYLNPEKDELLKNRQLRSEDGADGEWEAVKEDDYDKIERKNSELFKNIKGELIYSNNKSGTSVKLL